MSGRGGGSAIVIAAHGSTRSQAANRVAEHHVQGLAALRLADEVTAAFHDGQPGFGDVLDQLTATRVVVVPFLTSDGYYTRSVLPEGLKQNRRFSALDLKVTAPLGTHPALAGLVASRAAALTEQLGLEAEETTVLIVGHGTRRNPQSRVTTLSIAARLRQQGGASPVLAAFLDDDPSVEDARRVVTTPGLVVIPFLIGGGGHALLDLPERIDRVRRPVVERVLIDRSIGEDPAITGLLAGLAAPHLHPKRTATGRVHLVGAGPGDPGLITVKGLELLRQADVVIHDRLIPPALLAEVRVDAEVISVGKTPHRPSPRQEEINTLLLTRALAGRTVVRLKGGDPFVFGRGSEELAACRANDIPCEIVSGVSSAIAVPAAAGIPVTERGVARSFAVVTGYTKEGAGVPESEIAALARLDTLVLLMGRTALGPFAAALIAAGRDATTPAAAIERGTTPAQRVVHGTLGDIAEVVEREGLETPMITVIGPVAAARC